MRKPLPARPAFALTALALLLPACGGSNGAPGAAGPSLPVLQSLSATGLPAAPGGTVTVTVTAQSPGGLALSYSWAVSGAGWTIDSGSSTATVTLTAPSTYGTPGSATVTVTDSASRVGTGLASLITVGNSAPIIHTLNATPNPVTLAGTMTASVTASDPNGDALTYTWSVPSGLTIQSGQGTAQIQVTAAVATSGTLSVSVSDGTAPAVLGQMGVGSRHGWGASVLLEASAGPANSAPKVAMNAAGQAMAVWVQADSVVAARYTPAGGWETPAPVEAAAPAASFPQIVLDGPGNAIAVWLQSDGVAESVWANRFTPGGGWGTPTLLDGANTPPSSHQLAGCIPSGEAVAVWSQSDGSVTRIWSNLFTPGGGWTGAAIIDLLPAEAAVWPAVAMNDVGNAVVVWRQNGMRTRTYDGGVGLWSGSTPVMGTTWFVAEDTRVALNASGEAVAVWNSTPTGNIRRRANRSLLPTLTWQTDELIDSFGQPSFTLPFHNQHRIAIDAAGFGMAFWSVPDDAGSVQVWANRLTPTGWEGPVFLQDDPGSATNPALAMDPMGNAVAAWVQGSTNIVARFFSPAGGWEPVETLDPAGFGPDLAASASGAAILVYVGGGNIRAVHRR